MEHASYACEGALQARGFFLYFNFDIRPKLSEKERKRARGGKSFFGTIANIRESLGLSMRDVMHRYSWVFIMLQMGDKSWTDFDFGKEDEGGKPAKGSNGNDDIIWVKTPEDLKRLRAEGKI